MAIGNTASRFCRRVSIIEATTTTAYYRSSGLRDCGSEEYLLPVNAVVKAATLIEFTEFKRPVVLLSGGTQTTRHSYSEPSGFDCKRIHRTGTHGISNGLRRFDHGNLYYCWLLFCYEKSGQYTDIHIYYLRK